MQKWAWYLGLLLVGGTGLLNLGCGTSEPSANTTDSAMIDDLLNAGDNGKPEPAEPVEGDHSRSNSMRPVSRSVSANADRSNPAALGDRLELRLQEGDRFPLVKTIEQTLQQKSEIAPAFAFTRLELTMAINVEKVTADAILMSVFYSRVNYEHDVAGQRLSFDSSNHQGAVPWDVIPYAGMVGNGFSFWLGRDNSIREMVGYKEFLERCVAQVPLERRENLLAEISNRFGDDGVANFVDDSIGMLPFDATVDRDSASRVLPGDVWTRERRLMQPVPVHLSTTYRLSAMNEKTAEIEITGRVASGDAAATVGAGRLRISGGHALGRCVVDRATGLPLEMNLTRLITMKITTSDAQEVVQEKQIVTTIRAFPEVRGPVADMTPPPATPRARIQRPVIQRVSGIQGQDVSAPEPGSNADLTTPTVRAVYPD